MTIKSLIGASAAAFLALSSVAYAADAIEPAPEASIPVFSWTGAYIGLNAGYAGGTAEHPFSVSAEGPGELANGSLDLTSSGFVGGAQIGYNYQINRFVVGLEADIQGSGVKGEGSLSASFGGDDFDAKLGTKLDWYGTVRARVGTTVTDRFMVYATGGLAYGQTKSYVNVSADGDDVFSADAKKTKAGWTVGAGAEYAVTDHISFKTEYLYTDLGKTNLVSGDLGIDGLSASLDRKFTFHTVRVGVNYRF